MNNYDYDYIVVGSGFGGSVSAMRLSQKGYRVKDGSQKIFLKPASRYQNMFGFLKFFVTGYSVLTS